MITKEEFKKNNITEDLFLSAGMSWEDLCDIYIDFGNNKSGKYQDILDDFVESYLKDVNRHTEKEERNGDAREIYDEILPPDCIIDGKVYRSVHYIIKYKGGRGMETLKREAARC